jgi:hypothetical protein
MQVRRLIFLSVVLGASLTVAIQSAVLMLYRWTRKRSRQRIVDARLVEMSSLPGSPHDVSLGFVPAKVAGDLHWRGLLRPTRRWSSRVL